MDEHQQSGGSSNLDGSSGVSSLGYGSVSFPFLVLIAGAAVAVVLLMMEQQAGVHKFGH